MKILHIIAGLDNGGAEAVLFRLINKTHSQVTHSVVSFLGQGIYESRLRNIGVSVDHLGLSKTNFTTKFYTLVKQIKKINPDIIQTWMYHANLFGGIAGKIAGNYPVVWGIHHSNLSKENNKYLTRMIAKFSAKISYFVPSAIISCSENAALIHQNIGYHKKKFHIIPNGYDMDCFQPNYKHRYSLREKWKISGDEFLIGLIGRWDAQKDHHNLIQAISLLNQKNVRCVFVGPDICQENSDLVGLLEKYNIGNKIMLLGPRNDIPDIMNALDLHVLSSVGEAFPNVVAEAMACGTPCVVTDVGDAAYIVGDTGWVVPAKDPVKLAHAIENAQSTLKERGRDTLGLRCRKRIQDNFSIDTVADSYMTTWKQTIKSKNKSDIVNTKAKY